MSAVAAMLTAAFNNSSSYPYPDSSSGSSSSSAGSSDCAAALPWLVLLGRCCYACAVLVVYWYSCMIEPVSPATGGTSVQSPQWDIARQVLLANLQQLQYSLAIVVQWLDATGTVQQLTALGYQPQDMQQQLAEAADAMRAISTNLQAAGPSTGSSAALAVMKAAQQQLQAAGRVLTCFAVPHTCNNVFCSNLVGPSEAQLVRRNSHVCSGCHTARYCGKACQRAAWRRHKPVCKALAAAAAAAPSPAAPPKAATEAAAAVAGSPAEGDSQATE